MPEGLRPGADFLSPQKIGFYSGSGYMACNLGRHWQGVGRHSGVPSNSLFNCHWASMTQREQEALDPNDSGLFSIPTPQSCSRGSVVLAVVQTKMSPEGDRQGLCGQMVVRSNNEYLNESPVSRASEGGGMHRYRVCRWLNRSSVAAQIRCLLRETMLLIISI